MMAGNIYWLFVFLWQCFWVGYVIETLLSREKLETKKAVYNMAIPVMVGIIFFGL